MAYASRSGKARTNSSNPQAFGVCDRCSQWYNFVNLRYQYQWGGASLINTRFLVCNNCYDTPQEQLRSIVLPADPVSIVNARVEPFAQDSADYQTITAPIVYDPITGIPIPSTTTLITQDGQNLTTEPFGRPVGLEQNAVMPLYGNVKYGVKLNPLSVISAGTDIISVTFSAAHGLATNDQISVEGLSVCTANGFYSVVVASAMALSYQTFGSIAAGSLLTSHANMITCLVGLPRGYDTIPQVGP